MSLTPQQLAKIREKEASTPEALRRNPYTRYTEGWFHVTLRVREDAPILGFITGDAAAPDGSATAPRSVLSPLGEKVEEVWRRVHIYHPMCECDELKVMPDHLHALLHLLPGNREHLGSIINGLMIGGTHCYWDTLGIPWREMRQQKDAAASAASFSPAEYKAQEKSLRAQWQDSDHTRSFRGPALLVHGYNDVEAVSPEEIEIKREYIRNNPRKHVITRSKRDRFSIHRQRTSRNWHLDAVKRGLCADRFFSRDAAALSDALTAVLPRLNTAQLLSEGAAPSAAPLSPAAVPPLRLDIVGNVSLLAAERKLPLICHRSDAALFERQREAVLQAAREGAVIVSAFISPKERDIMKALLQEFRPVVEIMDNGFSDRYKPTGKSFYATAEDRLCQITPWTHLYQRDVKVTREMCMVMNELVRIISTEQEDWWK